MASGESFLTKLGKILSVVVTDAEVFLKAFSPVFAAILPNSAQPELQKVETYAGEGVSELSSIGAEIANIESVAASGVTMTDAQKINAAVSGVSQVIATSPFMVGMKVVNTAQYTEAVTLLTQAMTTLLGAIDKA